jgi:hypothetical protein
MRRFVRCWRWGWRPVADEYAMRQARIFLGRVGPGDRRLGADQREGAGLSTDFEGGPGRGAREGDRLYGQEYLCEFVEREGAVFPRELIEAAMQDFEPLDL